MIPPGTRIDFADFPGLIEEMRAFRSMFVPNAQERTRGEAQRHAKRLGLFSSLRIPIVIGAEFERILALQWERVIPEPAPSMIAVMRRFADQAGLAIEQAARRHAQEETRELQAVTEALAAAATPRDVGSAIVRQGVRALRARAGTVYVVTEDGESIELVASEGYSAEVIREWGQIPLDAATPLTEAIRSGEIIVCASPDEIVERYPWFDDTDQSFVVAPLLAAGRAIGGIYIGAAEARDYRESLSLVFSLARQAGQALDRAQLFERQRASAGRLRKLQAVTAALSQAVTLEDVSRTCLEHAAMAIDAPAGVVVLRGHGWDPVTDEVGVVASIGLDGPEGEIPEAADALIRSSLRAGRPGWSGDGWIALPLASGALALALPPDSTLAARRQGVVADARQPGRAGARPGGTLRDRARRSRRRCSGACCPSGSRRWAASRSRLATSPARSASTWEGTGTTSSSSRTAPSASSSATSSGRACRPRR